MEEKRAKNGLHPYPMHPNTKGGFRQDPHNQHTPKSRWKTLSNAFKKLRKGEENKIPHQPFRFPAFEVVELRPDIAPKNALDRLWLRVSAPGFNSDVDLKVISNFCLFFITQSISIFHAVFQK